MEKISPYPDDVKQFENIMLYWEKIHCGRLHEFLNTYLSTRDALLNSVYKEEFAVNKSGAIKNHLGEILPSILEKLNQIAVTPLEKIKQERQQIEDLEKKIVMESVSSLKEPVAQIT